jgi:rubredoxin
MQKYSENCRCPKCGFREVATQFHPYPNKQQFNTLGSFHLCDSSNIWNEHIDRRCNRCGYVWAQECLSKTDEETPF